MSAVVIHSKTGCPFCEKAKAFLTERGLQFKVITYDDFSERQAMYDDFGLEGGERTVPQIVVADKRIGGYNDLVKYYETETIDFNEDF